MEAERLPGESNTSITSCRIKEVPAHLKARERVFQAEDAGAHVPSCLWYCFPAGKIQHKPRWCGVFLKFVLETGWRVIRCLILTRQ